MYLMHSLFRKWLLYFVIYMLTFCTFQNLLGGALFGVWKAFPLCCLLTAIGATCCYLLSYAFGRALVMKYFSNRIAPLQKRVRTREREKRFHTQWSILPITNILRRSRWMSTVVWYQIGRFFFQFHHLRGKNINK